jgi:hypothetical protein
LIVIFAERQKRALYAKRRCAQSHYSE